LQERLKRQQRPERQIDCTNFVQNRDPPLALHGPNRELFRYELYSSLVKDLSDHSAISAVCGPEKGTREPARSLDWKRGDGEDDEERARHFCYGTT
jgi:hypothetical protein